MEHSLLLNVKDQNPRHTASTEQIIKWDKSDRYKTLVTNYREAKARGDTALANKLKVNLPAVVSTGICKNKVNDQSLVHYNGKVCVDIDKLMAQGYSPEAIRNALSLLLCVEAAAISCGADGVFAFVKHSAALSDHAIASEQIADMIEARLGVICDRRIMKIKSSRRFATWDPEAYYNGTSTVFHIIPTEEYDLLTERKAFTDKVITFEEGNRNAYIFQLGCNCKSKGIDQQWTEAFASQYCASSSFDETEITKTLRSAYGKAEIHESVTKTVGKVGKVGKLASTELEGNKTSDSQSYATPIDKSMFPEGKIFEYAMNLAVDDVQQSVMCLSLVTAISSCLPKCFIQYSKKYYPNLYLGIIAPAGGGKGIVDKAISVTQKLDEELHAECAADWDKYKQAIEAGEKATKPDRPECSGLLIPDDASTASFIDGIKSSQGTNLETTTEMDTKVRSNHGVLMIKDDVYRKAWEHEKIHKTRKSDDEPTIIRNPKLSILMAGTQGAFLRLFPHGSEDGTLSRFLFYTFGNDDLEWVAQFGLSSNEYEC